MVVQRKFSPVSQAGITYNGVWCSLVNILGLDPSERWFESSHPDWRQRKRSSGWWLDGDSRPFAIHTGAEIGAATMLSAVLRLERGTAGYQGIAQSGSVPPSDGGSRRFKS